jgi:hypothetical protein
VTSLSLTPEDRSRLRVLYWTLIIVCLIFSGAGWYLVVWQTRPLENWIPVTATVRRVDVIEQKDSNSGSTKRPVILYSYAVDSVVYTTDRVTPSSDVRDPATVSALAAGLHEGQSITAYHDPFQPGSAYLVRSRHRILYVLAVGPLLLAVILLANWQRVRRNT